MRTYYGTDGRDIFDGSQRGERVYGYGGNDDLFGYRRQRQLLRRRRQGPARRRQRRRHALRRRGLGSARRASKGDDALDGGSGFDYADYFYAAAGVDREPRDRHRLGRRRRHRHAASRSRAPTAPSSPTRSAATPAPTSCTAKPANDVLIGGGGQDLTVGDAGADHFVFADGDVSDKLATRRSDRRFQPREGDKIDLARDRRERQCRGRPGVHLHRRRTRSAARPANCATRSTAARRVLMGDIDGDKVADGYIRVDTDQPLVVGRLRALNPRRAPVIATRRPRHIAVRRVNGSGRCPCRSPGRRPRRRRRRAARRAAPDPPGAIAAPSAPPAMPPTISPVVPSLRRQ